MSEMSSQRIKEIFSRAAELPPEQRTAFLDTECGAGTPLRQRVEQLLQSLEQVGPFLASPTASSTIAAKLPRAEIGASLGPYKLLQQIGEGGFGVVYMAEQHEPVRRRVALKVIKAGMDTAQVIARFEAERQALALMDHPNIARVLDAGTTDGGRPYFVMDLVKGIPITNYCDEHNLGTRERLRLFIEVCNAVQHAHQKGVIHRDIKPTNVMVTLHDGDPVAKVIDFGVAKATSQRLTERTLFTAFGQFIGTPAYMSPEQAEMSGLDVDTRSDVYSLGVLLYELLTGTTPFDAETLRAAAYTEIQRMIKEVEPQRPSARLTTLGEELTEVARHRGAEPATLARSIRGDLDWIVMKALEKDRSRRYGSASDLAADIERHFDNSPVLAGPPSSAYRLRKFVVKHRGTVAATLAVLVTIVALGSVSLWQGLEAARQAARVNEQAERVRASSILATAAAAEDPVVRALMLKELADAPEMPGRLRVARDAANHPVPRAVLRGHRGWVTDVDVSPDGRLVATVEEAGSRIWRSDGTGRPLILEHEGIVTVEFSRDGTRLLTGSATEAKVWPVEGNGHPVVFPGGRASFCLNGAGVITVSDGTIRVWAADGTGEPTVVGDDLPRVSTLATDSDGRRMVAGFKDGSVRLWSVDEGGKARRFRGGDRPVTGVAIDDTGWPDRPKGPDEIVAFYRGPGEAGTLRFWRLDRDEPPRVFVRAQAVGSRGVPMWREEGTVHPVVFSGKSAQVIEASYVGSTLGVSRDGFLVADGYWQGAATVRGGAVRGESLVLRGESAQVLAAAFSDDRTIAATGHADGTARVWPIGGGDPLVLQRPPWEREHPGITGVDFSPDGSRAATASRDGTARIWRADGSGEPVVLRGHDDALTSIAFSPDGTRVVTASLDGTARIRAADGTGEPAVLRHAGQVVDAVFSPDGSRVATAVEDTGEARIWSADGKGEPIVLRGRESRPRIQSIAFSPDGARVVTGGPGQKAWVWRADGIGDPIPLAGYEHIWGVAFSPDGSRIAMGCGDGRVLIWNADGTGEPVFIHEHLDEAFHVEFGPDGTRLLTASEDWTARVTWLDGSREPLVLRGHGDQVWSARFSPDGARVITGSADDTARVWRVTWPGLLGYFDETVRACLTPEQRERWLAEGPAEARSAHADCERRLGR